MTTKEGPAPPSWRRARAAIGRGRRPVVLLLALQALLLAHTAWDKSDTADEGHYLATAFRQWQYGDLVSNCESPALPKWGFALALRLSDPRLFDPSVRQGLHPLWSRPLAQTRLNLFAARCATIAVTLAAGVFVFLAASRFGRAAGLAALALWCLSPTVLANGALATLDPWAAAGSAFALWTGVRLIERPSPGRAAVVGAALGLAAATKVTALGLAPVAVVALLWAARRHARRTGGGWLRPSSLGLAALAAGFVVALWAVYGFRLSTLDTSVLCGQEGPGLRRSVVGPLPAAPWLEGLRVQMLHGAKGHRSYLFGQVKFDGWWWFYLAALALKTTVGAQGLALLRVASSWKRRASLLADVALLAFPLLLLAVMSAGRAQNGIKYILPAFPFAIVWLARVVDDARAALGGAARIAAIALLCVGAGESLAVHPHHLMFFNLWAGGPDGGPRYLIHGDDWGQDQRRLAEWQRATRPWRLHYTYYSGSPHHWGVSYEPPSCEPRIGYHALQAVEVHRPKRIRPGCLDWLTVEPPDERLGHSIYIYLVNKARIERLAEERGHVTPFWSSAPQAAAGSGDEPEPEAEPGAYASPSAQTAP